MKRGGPLKRRTRLKAHSERGQSYVDELNELRPLLNARSGGRCEVQANGDHHGWVVPHHRKRRSQGGPNTLANLLMACEYHHRIIHMFPDVAYDAGLLIRRADPITPYLEAP
jgi:hypothetical protein